MDCRLDGRRQAIIWTYAGILFIRLLGTNFNEILIEIWTFSFKKMHLKMSSGKWRPSCPASMLKLKNGCGWVSYPYIWKEKNYFIFFFRNKRLTVVLSVDRRINNVKIDIKERTKFLGVIIDEHLSYKIYQRVSSKWLRVLYECRPYFNRKYKDYVYGRC